MSWTKGKWLLLFVVGYFLTGVWAVAQCPLDTNVVIHKTDTIDIIIPVRDILNDDLGNPQQGLCRIDLTFDHEYVGDLLIRLQSPSGQEVQLTGPEVMSGWTAFQKWDISFVRSGDMANPDAGFSARWSNDQTWGVGGAGGYTGSYYPFQGRLEDFNTGRVNGDWLLHIEDRTRFYGGHIRGYRLVFCDSIGPYCSSCSPNSVAIESDDILACEGDETLDITPVYKVHANSGDSSQYETTFYLIGSDTVLQRGLHFDLRSSPPGQYSICGVNYFKNHVGLLLPDGSLWKRWAQLLNVDSAGICAALSDRCIQVEIFELPDTVFLSDVFCGGGTYTFADSVYRQPGTYVQPFHTRKGGCDSIVVLTLDTVSLVAELLRPDTLTCQRDSVVLVGRGENGSTGLIWQWQTDSGHIRSINDDSLAIVDQPGWYRLILSKGQCRDTADTYVPEDEEVPYLFIEDAVLDCNTDSFCLSPIAPDQGLMFEWYDEDGVLLAKDTPYCIHDTGKVSLIVRAQNGCTASRSVSIHGDFDVPVPLILSDTLTCTRDSVILSLVNAQNYITWTWQDPQGQVILQTDSFILVRNPGKYSIRVVGENGCTILKEINVMDLRHQPVAIFKEPTISCRDTIVQLSSGLDTMAPVVINWVSPSGKLYVKSHPRVKEPGNYRLHYVDKNGCVLDTQLMVLIDTLPPQLRYTSDTIKCDVHSVELKPTGDTAGVGVQWTGPGGFISEEIAPRVSRTGRYTAIIRGKNGCENYVDLMVVGDTSVPDLILTAESNAFDCYHRDSIRLNAQSSKNGLLYQWSGTSGDLGGNPQVYVHEPGQYKVVVMTRSNCVREDSILIGIDTAKPVFRVLVGDTITCLNRTSQWVIALDDTLANVRWDFLGSTFDTDTVRVNASGTLKVVVTGGNGCADSVLYAVPLDTIAPELDAIGDTLNCRIPVTRLQVSGDTTIVRDWRWVSEDGSALDGHYPMANMGGTYYLEVEGRNGCFSYDSTFIHMDTIKPVLHVSNDTLDCQNRTATLMGRFQGVVDSFYWTGDNIQRSHTQNLTVSEAGIYRFVAIGTNGCRDSVEAVVFWDTIPPVIDFELIDSLDCNHTIGRAVLHGVRGKKVSWNPVYGKIDAIRGDSLVEFSDSIKLIVKVRNRINGCQAIDTVSFADQRIPPTKLVLDISPPNCYGASEGSIVVDSVVGRFPPYFYFLNDQPKVTGHFTDLSSGRYMVRVQGRNGCALDTVVILPEPMPLIVIAGNDTTIVLGGRARLKGRTIPAPNDSVLSALWSPDRNVTCPSCLQTEAQPNTTQSYVLSVVSVLGCEGQDTVVVTVLPKSGLFLPNTFTPNGDQVNDIWKAYFSNGNIARLHLDIFDRWGGHIKQADIISQEGNEVALWDGMVHGKLCNPGVYVYRLSVVDRAGMVLSYHGSITLIR